MLGWAALSDEKGVRGGRRAEPSLIYIPGISRQVLPQTHFFPLTTHPHNPRGAPEGGGARGSCTGMSLNVAADVAGEGPAEREGLPPVMDDCDWSNPSRVFEAVAVGAIGAERYATIRFCGEALDGVSLGQLVMPWGRPIEWSETGEEDGSERYATTVFRQLVMPWGDGQQDFDGHTYSTPSVSGEERGTLEVVPPRDRVTDRQLFLDGLEAHTRLGRELAAAHHGARAAKAELEGETSKRIWHEQRRDGQIRRFATIRACMSRVLVRILQCGCAGNEPQEIPLGCSDWKACPVCRGKRVRRYRVRFRRSLTYWREQYRFAMRLGQWRERFLTLTLPHLGEVGERIKAVKRAWPVFLRMLKRHLAIDKGVPKNQLNFPFVAVLETTPGRDGRGHPHIHVWMLSPYLPHELIRLYWSRALGEPYLSAIPTRPLAEVMTDHKRHVFERVERRCQSREGWEDRAWAQWEREGTELFSWLVTRRGPHGALLEEVPWSVVDIRQVRDVESELIKYLLKEAFTDPETGELVFMDPELAAQIYLTYAGKRSIWTARGFWQDEAEPSHCRTCGSCHWHCEVVDRAELVREKAARSSEVELICAGDTS